MKTPEQIANLRKLVEALRSGRYEQGRGALRVGDQFCCLGVACDLSGVGKWLLPAEKGRIEGRYVYVGKGTNTMVVEHAVQDFFGFENCAGFDIPSDRIDGDTTVDLTQLNDRGMSFQKIADHIEAFIARESK